MPTFAPGSFPHHLRIDRDHRLRCVRHAGIGLYGSADVCQCCHMPRRFGMCKVPAHHGRWASEVVRFSTACGISQRRRQTRIVNHGRVLPFGARRSWHKIGHDTNRRKVQIGFEINAI